MKNVLMVIVMPLLFQAAMAQVSTKNELANKDVIYIAPNRTLGLVFNKPIRYIDRGTTDILAQRVTGAEQIVLLKAAVDRFKETNLSVITDDGSLYSFEIKYTTLPVSNTYYVKEDTSFPHSTFNNESLDPAAINTYSYAIIDNAKNVSGVKKKKAGITASVDGIYVKANVLFFHLKIINETSLDYDIDLMRLYLTDRKTPKRTAIQEQEQQPLTVTGNIRTVKAGDTNMIVVALSKFSIPDKKYLVIQLLEKNGGRYLTLKVRNSKILKAKILPDLK